MSILKEFREFAARGNVIDLAVAVVLGTAFGAITKSLVDDIIMPVVGLLLGGVDFSNFFITLKAAVGDMPAVTLNYGVFINVVINFIIVAFAMFLLVKGINSLKRKQQAAPAEEKPAPPPEDVVLLKEIRDLLKARQ
jgi:large conductance mechanosensitive channel